MILTVYCIISYVYLCSTLYIAY